MTGTPPSRSAGDGALLQSRLQEIRLEFEQKLDGRLAIIEELARRAIASSGADLEAMKLFIFHVHKLTGAAGTFGFPALSEAAGELESFLGRLQEGGREFSPAVAAELQELVGKLAPSVRAMSAPSKSQTFARPTPRTWSHRTPPPRPDGSTRERNLIALVEDDEAFAKDLAARLEFFGYEVRWCPDLDSAAQLVPTDSPAAVLMDIVFPEGRLAGTEFMKRTQSFRKAHLPTVFISARSDLEARLAAVKSGADGYFAKPIEINALVEKLDALTQRHLDEPHRVLLVDDDIPLSDYIATSLRSHGLQVEVVNQPLEVMRPITDFNPDLVLMDLYMPDCTGIELAEAVRQQEAFVSLPIVFLSTESRSEKRLEVLRSAGDEFLTKPVDPDVLAVLLKSRAQRARTLRGLMERDSLTRLLNHSSILSRLDVELSRISRHGGRLALAIFDLDHFKVINDTYGHPTGDKVIRTFSRLLQEWLRRTDVAGRYGGEEFALILPETDPEPALRLMEAFRSRFEAIQHLASDGRQFTVTLSCGVACAPTDSMETSRLVDCADEALYQAKKSGRNRIVMYSALESGIGHP